MSDQFSLFLTFLFCASKIKRLEMFGIPVPRYALVNREVPYQELDYFVEEEDYVEVYGNRFLKPFVEKPVHGNPFLFLHLFQIVVNVGFVDAVPFVRVYRS